MSVAAPRNEFVHDTNPPGLVHVDVQTPLCAVVSVRHWRHFLRRILVPAPDGISGGPEHQHTSRNSTTRQSADVTNNASGMT